MEIENTKYRELKGPWAIMARVLMIAVPILGCLYIMGIHTFLGIALYAEQYVGLILGLMLALTFLLKPFKKTASREIVPWYDILFAFISVGLAIFLVIFYPKAGGVNVGLIEWYKVFLGTIAIILVLDASRRCIGWPLPILVIVFILYGRYTEILPGPLSTIGLSWKRIATSLFLEPGAMFGIPLRIGATMLLGFLIFGAFLIICGGGKFITDLAFSLLGKYRGGPAKVAVVASAFFGSLSGSAVANAVTTGTITIPLMKRTGYSPEFAAAVEATASSGGSVTPPIMGATAFIMAEFLAIPYTTVVLASIVPALLYYLCLITQVHLRAVKTNLVGLSKEETPPLAKTLARGWLTVIGFAVLIYSLFVLAITPEKAALYGAAAIIVCGLFRQETRLSLKGFILGLENVTRGMLDVVAVCAAAGLVIGVVMLTGVGLLFSGMLVSIVGDNVILLLVMVAVVSIIMGMGLPGIISYIMLAVLVVPSLQQLGLNPIASHLFLIYFGMLSFITPPVCIAIFVTSSMAGASINRAGLQGVRLAAVAYLLPFVFIFKDGLILQGSGVHILESVVTGLIAVFLLAFAIEGYFRRDLTPIKRFLTGIAGILLILPLGGWIASIIGICLAIVVLSGQLIMGRTQQNARSEGILK